jgi:hypothetical protein
MKLDQVVRRLLQIMVRSIVTPLRKEVAPRSNAGRGHFARDARGICGVLAGGGLVGAVRAYPTRRQHHVATRRLRDGGLRRVGGHLS